MSLPPLGILPTTFLLTYFSPVSLALALTGMLGPWVLAWLTPGLQVSTKISFPRTSLTLSTSNRFPSAFFPLYTALISGRHFLFMCEVLFYFFFFFFSFSFFPSRMSSPGGLVFHIPSSIPRTGVELPEPLCVRDIKEGIPSLGGKLHSIDPILLTPSCSPRVPHVSLPYWKNKNTF